MDEQQFVQLLESLLQRMFPDPAYGAYLTFFQPTPSVSSLLPLP